MWSEVDPKSRVERDRLVGYRQLRGEAVTGLC